MTPEQTRYDELMALLLDRADQAPSPDLTQARRCLKEDPAFRRDYDALVRVGARLESLGERANRSLGSIDIVDDVRDSIAHLAMEELSVANASPYNDVERALRDLKSDFDSCAGAVSIVDEVMEAVAAGHKSDEEMELPYLREASRLRLLGEALASHAPAVELVAPVRAEITRSRPVNVVPLRARSTASTVRVSSRPSVWPKVLGMAAVFAMLVSGLWFMRVTSDTGETLGPVAGVAPSNELPLATGPEPERSAETVPSQPFVPPTSRDGEGAAAPDSVRKVSDGKNEPLTLQEVITARRQDLVNDSRAIAAMASMTEAEAIALLKEMDLSIEALIGATEFLSTEEAIAVLRAAIAGNPDDPHLRMALARNLGDGPEMAGERMENLAQLAAADSSNGLPYYMMASEYFARGDVQLGMDALSRGSGYSESTAYALEGIQQHEAALIANGTPPDVARLLALSMAGDTEYYDVSTLRNELLEYGAQYEEQGDFDTAQQIYNAVNRLGGQLANGADMALELEYGLETQHEAFLAIQGIAEALQDPEIAAWLGDPLNTLVAGIADVAGYIRARQEMVINPSITNQIDWSGYLEHVIRNGDLDISDFLP